jgi:SAM-dependent methyltransferase
VAPEGQPGLGDRLFADALAVFEIASVYLGDRLGYYRALADGPATSVELAARTGTDERYGREWLEQQAVAGILDVEGIDGPGSERRFALPEAHRPVLLDAKSLDLMAPLARMQVSAIRMLPSLVEAYRTGAGVGWADYGADMREGQADFNRPAFTHLLAPAWLGAIEDVDRRLRSDPPARVADVACGEGRSSIAIARGYPKARVVGIDLDEPSIAAARRHAREAGLADRIEFRAADAGGLTGPYDLALIIEAVHDMSDPVSVMKAVRGSLAADGSLVVVDERVAERFTAPGDDIERFMYGWSLLVCLPDGRSRRPSVATGTVMRPETLRSFARDAGFSSVEVLPIENDFFRFYRLRP